jgi:DNA-binding transcriptional ArsR family regulator
MFHTRPRLDPDIASTAALLGDPSRARILQALADGRALPATELARAARVTPQTASAHLSRLVAGGMLEVERHGRHRYFCLTAGAADLLERLAAFTMPAVTSSNTHGPEGALRFARTCYRHLAGRLGTAVTQALCDAGHLQEADTGYEITTDGQNWLRKIDIDTARLHTRPVTRRCLDWSERRPHLGGALGAALLSRFMQLKWLLPMREPRCLRLTTQGRTALQETLGLQLS